MSNLDENPPAEPVEDPSGTITLTIPKDLGKRIGERTATCSTCRCAVYMELISAINDPGVFLHTLITNRYLTEEEQVTIANGLVRSSPTHEITWKAFLETCHEVDRGFRHAYPKAAEIITDYALGALPLEELFTLTTAESCPFSWRLVSSPMAIKCAKAIREKHGTTKEYEPLRRKLCEANNWPPDNPINDLTPEHIEILIRPGTPSS